MSEITDIELVATLRTAFTGVSIYSDFVPENEPMPAISYSNVTYLSGRVLSGRKTRRQTVWRVMLVSNDDDEVESMLGTILTLDNTSNEYFQRVFVEVVNREQKLPLEPTRRIFVDMTVTI